jgi:hypothetical protein
VEAQKMLARRRDERRELPQQSHALEHQLRASIRQVFQLAHCVEGTVFVPAAPKIEVGWADHQMRTTANFGKTPLTTFITGGLDHQIEHHLFPRICHIHYRAIAPIVRQCAHEHGLPYIHNGSDWQALASHARTMRRIGRGESLPVGEVEARPPPSSHRGRRLSPRIRPPHGGASATLRGHNPRLQ